MSLKYVLGVACAAVLTASAQAQINSPDQPQPAVPARQDEIPTGMLDNPGVLYRLNDVSKSLKLTPEQVNRLNKLTEQTQRQYRDKYTQLNTLKDTERAARTQELNRQYYGDWSKGAHDIFNEEQQKRYQQLVYQYGGFSTLTDPALAMRLHLTPEQQKTLMANLDWSHQQLRHIYRTSMVDRDRAMDMYHDYQKQYQERFSKLLTPEQQKAWLDMAGEPYSFQPAFTPSPQRNP